MRVALLLYGKLHIHTQYRPHCSQYYDLLNFIGRENTIDIFYSGDYESEEWVSIFKENYKPVKCVIDRIIHSNIMSAYPGRLPGVDNEALYDIGCNMINKMKVFMLLEEHMKETNANYDIVICMNNHVKVNTHLDLSNSAIGENIVYIPVREQEIEGGGLNDTLAIGRFETMKKYCELYKYLQYLLDQKLSIPSAEHLNLASLIYNKVNIVRIPFSYSILNE